MSPDQQDAAPTESLQFDHAEYMPGTPQGGAAVCAACQMPLSDQYFEAGGHLVCAACAERIRGEMSGGSPARRALKALCFGGLAAIAGAALYYGVVAITKLEIGLVAIVVGLMVGGAVRAGAEARGGWFYQVMAILLTYLSVAASYSTLAIQELISQSAGSPPAASESAPQEDDSQAPKSAATDREAAADSDKKPPNGTESIVAVLIFIFLLLSLPIAANLTSPIGLLIVGFALFEAWKLNQRVAIKISGPHALSARIPAAAAAPAGEASSPVTEEFANADDDPAAERNRPHG